VIVTWEDLRISSRDIYAQRVDCDGDWGDPRPFIVSVDDSPNDQGGKMIVTWDNSSYDADPSQVITHYTVWKKYEGAAASMSALIPGGDVSTERIDALASAARINRGLASNLIAFGWEYVSDPPAIYEDEYSMTVPTYGDSSASGIPYCQVKVLAHTSDPWTYWTCDVDSGYSVDNLSPCIPYALAGEYIGGMQIRLHWNPNAEPDLHHYAVYRGESAGFVPGPGNLLGTCTDSSYVDGYGYGTGHYYKVSAWDVHDNESPFALLTPDEVTGLPGAPPPHANALYQNAPNPFSSSTRIAFALNKKGHVRLQIFDAKGRLVRTLADEERAPNNYVEFWDGRDGNGRRLASGTYFYRISAPYWDDVKKMTLAR
jgi:hypothetical protein